MAGAERGPGLRTPVAWSERPGIGVWQGLRPERNNPGPHVPRRGGGPPVAPPDLSSRNRGWARGQHRKQRPVPGSVAARVQGCARTTAAGRTVQTKGTVTVGDFVSAWPGHRHTGSGVSHRTAAFMGGNICSLYLTVSNKGRCKRALAEKSPPTQAPFSARPRLVAERAAAWAVPCAVRP